jgi:hypothetical protein
MKEGKAMFAARQGRQIIVKFKNRIGLLFDISKLIAEKGISVLAVCCNISGEDGILWLVTDDNLRATDVINESGSIAEEEEVILVELPHKPGMLKQITQALALEEIDIWYLYATVLAGQEKCLVVLRTGNDERALSRLHKARGRPLERQP